MDTQTTEPTAVPVHVAPAEDAGDLDSRAASLLAQLEGEQKAADRAEAHPDAEPTEAPAKAKAAPSAVEEPPTQDAIAEARRARIAANNEARERMAAEERAKVAASKQKKAERQPHAVEQAPGVAITDAASFFAAAEKLAIPPQELAAWLTGQQDPSKVATAAAKSALTPVEQKLKELEEKQAAFEARQAAAVERAQVAQLVEQNHRLLASHLDSVKHEAPLAAAFMTSKPAKFRAAVESICDELPPGFTAQDVIDHLEEELLDLQLPGSPAAAAAPTSSAKPKNPAAVKANVGNRLAAERATTVEDDGDDAGGDLEDRARKLKARLAAG